MRPIIFRAVATTHAERAVHNGRTVVSVTDHGARSAAYLAFTGRAAEDSIRYGVTFADGSSSWATAREIGRA